MKVKNNFFSNGHRQLLLACGLKRFGTREGKGTFSPGIVLLDERGKVYFQADLKFSPHYILQHPINLNSLILLDKGGPVGAVANMTTDKKLSLKYFKASSSSFSLYGHGVFFDENRKFIGTERSEDSRGQLVIRDSGSFEVLSTIPLPGYGLHDCLLVDGEKLLAVAMDGLRSEGTITSREHKGCVLIFDLESKSVVEKMESESEAGFGHLAYFDGLLVGLETGLWSEGTRGLLSVGKLGGVMTSLKGISEINKWGSMETLSATIDSERSRVIVTNPMGNVVTIWDLKTKNLLGFVDIPTPSGIFTSPDLDKYVVTSATGFIFHIDPEKFGVTAMMALEVPGHFQSHLTGVYL